MILSLVVKQNSLLATFFAGRINCGHREIPFSPPHYFHNLTTLFESTGTRAEDIESVLVTSDFSDLYFRQRLPRQRIGYIRYYAQNDLPEPFPHRRRLRNLVTLIEVNENRSLAESLNVFLQEPVSALAVNPAIFVWPDFSVEEIRTVITKKLGPDTVLSIGATFNKIGYSEREELTLLNTLLLPGVKFFYDSLQLALSKLGINCRIFTLKGNGTLLSEKRARSIPVTTFGALFANQLLAAARLTHDGNLLFLQKSGTALYLGIGEGFIPKLPLQLQWLKGTGLIHPALQKISLLEGHHKYPVIKEQLRLALIELTCSEAALPIILSASKGKMADMVTGVLKALNIPVKRLQSDLDGAIYAPVAFEQEHYFSAVNQKERRIKTKNLWAALSAEVLANGFQPDLTWKSYWEEKTIRYLPQPSSLVRLGYHGPAIINRQTKSSQVSLQNSTLLTVSPEHLG